MEKKLSFAYVYNKKLKLIRQLKNMTPTEIVDYLDHVSAAITTDYETLFTEIRKMLDNKTMSKQAAINLQWSITKLHTAMLELHQVVKDQQRFIKDADAN